MKSKIDMLDNLLEIEIAYNLLSTDDTSKDKVKLRERKRKSSTIVVENRNATNNLEKLQRPELWMWCLFIFKNKEHKPL